MHQFHGFHGVGPGFGGGSPGPAGGTKRATNPKKPAANAAPDYPLNQPSKPALLNAHAPKPHRIATPSRASPRRRRPLHRLSLPSTSRVILVPQQPNAKFGVYTSFLASATASCRI